MSLLSSDARDRMSGGDDPLPGLPPAARRRPRLILPGLDGSGPGHWQHHWAATDPDAILVEQENWSRPDLSAWTERLLAAIGRHPGALIIAHSLACVLTAHTATRFAGLPIAGALLVAPADVDCPNCAPERIRAFAPIPVARLPFPTTVVGSHNDPYMTFPRARALAEGWGAEFVDLGHAGHINIAAGFGPWPRGFRLAGELEARIDAAAPCARIA